ADLNGIVSQRFDEFWQAYPRKQHRDEACRAWLSVVTTENEAAAFACLQGYLQSDEVSRGIFSNPDKWLFEQARNSWAGEWPKPMSIGPRDKWARGEAVGPRQREENRWRRD